MYVTYLGNVTVKRKDNGQIVYLTGEGGFDTDIFDVVSGQKNIGRTSSSSYTPSTPTPAPPPIPTPTPPPTTIPTPAPTIPIIPYSSSIPSSGLSTEPTISISKSTTPALIIPWIILVAIGLLFFLKKI